MGVNMQTRGAGRRGERWRPPRPGGPAVPRGRGDERAGGGPAFPGTAGRGVRKRKGP